MEFMDTIKTRRSVYEFTDEPVTASLIDDLARDIVSATPSAYNAQTQRVVVLHNESHLKLWEMVERAIKKEVTPENFVKTRKKLAGFKRAQGTILFFDDRVETEALKKKFPLYAEAFQRWSLEQNGMLQVNVWNALASIGIGASLQHYNELIQSEVQKEFQLPEGWLILAQMPFGRFSAAPEPKTKIDISKRMKILD